MRLVGLLIALLASLLPQMAHAQQGVICKRQPVPDGYVIVGETYMPRCYGQPQWPNAWVIERAVVPEIEVCRESPIPAGYMIVNNTLLKPQCPRQGASQYTAYLIRIPWDQEIVCRNNVIDSNRFNVLRTETVFECSDLGPRDNALYIERRGVYRGYCSGRSDVGGSYSSKLEFDLDSGAKDCAQRMADAFRAEGTSSFTITFGTYQFDARIQLELVCRTGNATWVSADGRKAFEMAQKQIANAGLKGCMLRPTTFAYETLHQ